MSAPTNRVIALEQALRETRTAILEAREQMPLDTKARVAWSKKSASFLDRIQRVLLASGDDVPATSDEIDPDAQAWLDECFEAGRSVAVAEVRTSTSTCDGAVCANCRLLRFASVEAPAVAGPCPRCGERGVEVVDARAVLAKSEGGVA